MKQSNIFKPTLEFSQKTSVSNVNVSNDNFRLSKASSVSLFGPVLLACFIVCTAYVVKFDSTVAKTSTTQIIRRGHIHLKNNHNIIIRQHLEKTSVILCINIRSTITNGMILLI